MSNRCQFAAAACAPAPAPVFTGHHRWTWDGVTETEPAHVTAWRQGLRVQRALRRGWSSAVPSVYLKCMVIISYGGERAQFGSPCEPYQWGGLALRERDFDGQANAWLRSAAAARAARLGGAS